MSDSEKVGMLNSGPCTQTSELENYLRKGKAEPTPQRWNLRLSGIPTFSESVTGRTFPKDHGNVSRGIDAGKARGESGPWSLSRMTGGRNVKSS